ncbi:MAG: YigZ family protein [Promicromonosporaceae bacterium]|nr:YigZ family protein [Promicromonosporaceae bacterium]
MPRELPWTIAAPVTHELIVKKSRFLTHLRPTSSIAEADAFIAQVRKEHWSANHNCVALVIGQTADQQRSSDDGEPSGTAGVPMLEVLRQRGVTDVTAVVTRYFGGVLLGAGGLIRAYGNAVSQGLDLARPVYRRHLHPVAVEVGHTQAGRLENLLRDWARRHESSLQPTSYGAAATLHLLVPPPQADALRIFLAAETGGAVAPDIGPAAVHDVA